MRLSLNNDFPSVDPGSFRHMVTLLSPVSGSDSSGSVTNWEPNTPPVTAWVKIDYLRGDEIIKAGQDVSRIFLKITGWWRSEFAANSTRLQLPHGNIVIVQYVENVKFMNTYMVLTCKGIGANE